jgi:hypothetical protein
MDIMNLLAQARPNSLDPETDRRANDLARAFAAPRNGMGVKPGVRRGPSRARVIGVGISVAALAGTAGAVVALSTSGAPAARPPAASAHAGTAVPEGAAGPIPGKLKNAILTAFDGIQGDIVYNKMSEIYSKQTQYNNVSESWTYPIQPEGGQLARSREVLVTAHPKEKSDTEWIYTEPRGAKAALPTKTQVIFVQYGNRTWSDTYAQIATQSMGASIQELRQSITSGKFTMRKTELNGQPVIELTTNIQANADDNVETMWINPVTNLPVRTFEGNNAEDIQVDYAFLPPTPANLAKLNPVIPPGFKKTATIQK